MDRDANYVAVGAFVVLVLAMATAFVLWYTDTRERRDMQRYEIYFRGTVSGLSDGAAVRYLGVNVGRVARIGLDERDPGRVRVVADIYEDTPIKRSTVARLGLLGVTGLLYIDLAPADPQKRPLPPVQSLRYPVIPSEQSDFDVLVSSLPEVVVRATEVLKRLNAVLSDKNLSRVDATLANIDRAAAELPATSTDARRMVIELAAAAREMQGAAANLRDLTATAGPDVKAAIARAREITEHLAAASARLDELLAANNDNLARFSDQGLADLERLMRDAREAAQEFRSLSRSLKEDPSRILYQPGAQGVEIPR
jgi:phospholipid/cholesterol/gamma-HCH transport system substrate-binding protein